MNQENDIRNAIIPSIIALIAAVLFFSFPMSLDRLAEFGSIIGILAVAALEYGSSWRKLFNR